MRLACLILVIIALAHCTKSIALEEEESFDLSFHTQHVGSSANHFLSAKKFTSLKVEIQYMKGFRPDRTAVAQLKNFLEEHLNKPDGVTIVTSEIDSPKDSVLNLEEIISIEKANRKAYSSGKELAVYILYTDGYYSDDKMLGYAYLNTSAVMFGRNIKENSNGFKKPSRTHLETRVLQHEIGHLLGLVNVGSPLQSNHKDNDHGKHCDNPQCLMYYLMDTEVPSFVLNKSVPKLDAACLADLKANGGKTKEVKKKGKRELADRN